MPLLKFSPQNAKTKHLNSVPNLQQYLTNRRKIYSLDLPAGLSCPGAHDCKSQAIETPNGWRIKDGPHCKFRCFSASQEIIFPNVRKARRHNYNLLTQAKTRHNIYKLLNSSLPKNAGIIRYFVSGDFFSLAFLRATIDLAVKYPNILFYGYTKSLHFLDSVTSLCLPRGELSLNFLMTASLGGKYDYLIPGLDIRTAKVVFSESNAKTLPIDHNDSHAATTGGSFALLLHGIQPKGTSAATAWATIKKNGGGYART